MKFGLGPYDLAAGGQGDHRAAYSQMLEQAAWAEEMAFDSFWVEESHFTGDGRCPAPMVAAAAVAARTVALRLGVVSAIPLSHPLYIAEDAATLDNISHGRLMLCAGKGQPGEAHGYGVGPGAGDGRFWEALEVILRSWRPVPFRHRGQHWNIPANLPENVVASGFTHLLLTPQPAQPALPVWVAASDDDAVSGAAALGLPILGLPADSLDELQRKLELYRSLSPTAGTAAGALWPVIRDVYIGETAARAREEAQGPLLALARRYQEQGRLPSGDLSYEALIADRFIVGDVDQCIDQISRYQDMGVDYMVCRLALPGLPDQRVVEAIKRFGRLVVAEFRMFCFPREIRERARQAAIFQDYAI
ncbi:MAG: LLM class flavin-dependent oxidoreductase [Chloroflexi bacterium]|nr:LLM class flavin-dependent oxidoreductase [Chloroflexota bacterium]